jgi:hypothetical protein
LSGNAPVLENEGVYLFDLFTDDAGATWYLEGSGVGDGEIGTSQLANDSVTTAKIVDEAVTVDKIGDEAVSNAKIEDGAVNNVKIADSAVSYGKLNNQSTDADNVAKRISKGFGDFDGVGSVTPNDSLGIDVIDYNGSGNYKVNLDNDNNMDNTDYRVYVGGTREIDGTQASQSSFEVYDKAVDSFYIQCWIHDQNKADFENVSFEIFGDLA